MLSALIAIGVLGVLVAIYTLLTYNRLVALRLNVDNAWAQVEVALRQRHDLVPNLAAAVAGYATHERATFEAVTAARQAATDAPSQAAGEQLSHAEQRLGQQLGALLAVAENYPQLQAAENFLALQEQLAEIESQLQITRRVYNDVVETYLTKTQTVPSVFVAKATGFAPREFFRAPIEARTAPELQLGN